MKMRDTSKGEKTRFLRIFLIFFSDDDDDVCYFASVHNSVYFAVLVLEKQQR